MRFDDQFDEGVVDMVKRADALQTKLAKGTSKLRNDRAELGEWVLVSVCK